MSVPLEVRLFYDRGPVDAVEPRKYHDTQSARDGHLVALARGGEYEAFEELVRRYRNDVVALAHHFVGNREEAWDLSQEVFLKVFKSLRQFRGDASFKTWLLRITANRCKDHFKKRRLKTVHLDEPHGLSEAPSPRMGPRAQLEDRELGDAIRVAMDGLPEKQRTAFILRELEGLSYSEMAKVMACSLGTVMSRLHHARKKLQNSLVNMGVVEDNIK